MPTALTRHHDYLPLGGGGLCRGIDAVANGGQAYLAHWTDGTMCGRLYPGDDRWKLLLTRTGVTTANSNAGVWEIRIAPSDPTRIYMSHNGFIYKSDDSGVSFSKTNFPQGGIVYYGNVNDNPQVAKYMRRTLAVDPVNKDVVISFVAPQDGAGNLTDSLVYYSSDGGTTVTKIGDTTGSLKITTSLSGNLVGAGICFDVSSGTTGGKTNRILLPTHNVGVWESTNAASTFTNIGGDGSTTGPVGNVPVADITADGVYFCADTPTPGQRGDATGTKLWKRASGAWSEVKDGGSSCTAFWLTCNPLTNGNILIPTVNGNFRISTDYGATWTSRNFGWTVDSTGDVHNINVLSSLTGCYFDSATNGKVWMTTGVGLLYANSIPTSGSFVLHVKTAGNEELVVRDMLAPPGDPNIVIVAHDDRSISRVFDADNYDVGVSTTTTFNGAQAIDHGSNVNWSSSDPTFLVAAVSNVAVVPLKSSDSGHNWSVLSNPVPWWVGNGAGMQFSQQMVAGQSVSGTVRTFLPGENPTDFAFGPVAFNTSWTQTMTDIGNAILAVDSRFVSFNNDVGNRIVEISCANGSTDLDASTTGYNIGVMPMNWTCSGSGTLPICTNSGFPTGAIVAASPTNWLAVHGSNGLPFYTKDGGVTWNIVKQIPSAITFSSAILSGQSFSGKVNGVSFGPVAFITDMPTTLTAIISAILAVDPSCGARKNYTAAYGNNSSVDSRRIIFFNASTPPSLTNLVVTGPGTLPTAKWTYATMMIHANFDTRFPFAADRVNIGTFYMCAWPHGLMRTTDGGDNWAIVKTGDPFDNLFGGSFWSAKMRCHPARAGEILWGMAGFAESLQRSTDGGVTWTGIANTSFIGGVDYGRPTVVGGPHSIWFQGQYNGVSGIWRSIDDGVTFTLIADVNEFTNNSWAGGSGFSADLNDHNRYYFSMNNGAVIGFVNRKWALSAAA